MSQKSPPEYEKLKPAALLWSLVCAASDIRKQLEKAHSIATPLWVIAGLLAAGLCLALWTFWSR